MIKYKLPASLPAQAIFLGTACARTLHWATSSFWLSKQSDEKGLVNSICVQITVTFSMVRCVAQSPLMTDKRHITTAPATMGICTLFDAQSGHVDAVPLSRCTKELRVQLQGRRLTMRYMSTKARGSKFKQGQGIYQEGYAIHPSKCAHYGTEIQRKR